MTVTSVEKSAESATMTVTSEFDAPVARVWHLWEDPRQLERWWGPPTYPATFVDHDLTTGGIVTYFMTGPDGDQPKGWWRVLSVNAPHHLEFEDGFGDDPDHAAPDLPVMTIRVAISEQTGGGTRMVIETTFPTPEAMEQIVAMGMEEGMKAALGQIDGLLA